jgi:hypothetical protein
VSQVRSREGGVRSEMWVSFEGAILNVVAVCQWWEVNVKKVS